MKKPSPLFSEVVVKSWWTILAFLLIFFLYDRGMHYRNEELQTLSAKLEELSREKQQQLLQRQDLLQQIESQSDNSWIELVLKRELGTVAEGEQKVLFVE